MRTPTAFDLLGKTKREAWQAGYEAAIAKALTLVPPASRQWVEDELRGRKRVAGEIVV